MIICIMVKRENQKKKKRKEDVPLVAEYNVHARRQPTVVVPSSEDLFSFA